MKFEKNYLIKPLKTIMREADKKLILDSDKEYLIHESNGQLYIYCEDGTPYGTEGAENMFEVIGFHGLASGRVTLKDMEVRH